MADEKKTVIIDVEVTDNGLDEQIGDINTALKDNRKEIKELNKDYKLNATEIAKLEQKNKDLSASKRELSKENGVNKSSLNGLRQELSKQTKERNNLNTSTKVGAERFEELQVSIAGLTDEISAAEQKGGDFRRQVGKYPEDMGKAKAAVINFGLALKALGIGLIIALFAKLSEVLSKNQAVADFFAKSIEAVEIVLNDLITFLLDNSDDVVAFFKDIFENPLENINALGKAIQDNLIGRFDSLIKAAGLLGDVFSKLFAGDFKGALDSAADAALEFGDAVLLIQPSAVIDSVKALTSSVSDYASTVLEAADANVELAKSAALVEANNKLLFESFDQQAEQLRQVRDEERNTIDERIAANNELSSVLEKQQELQLRQIDIAIASAQAQFDKNKNVENEVLLLDQLAEKSAILADIEGRRSEQLVNDLGLNREKLELENSLSEAINQRALDELDFQASQIENDELRNEQLQENLDFELDIESQRLNSIIESSKEGTQARQDAEQELLDVEQDIAQRRIDIEKTVKDTKKNLAREGLSDAKIIFAESEGVLKAFALGEIAVDTARAIGGLVAASESNPANAVTFGGAGVAQFAAGLLRIGANIKSASDLIGGSSVSIPTGGGGSVTAPTVSTLDSTLANVNAGLLSQFSEPSTTAAATAEATGAAVGNNIPNIQVSVVDINNAQSARQVKLTESSL